ncbi:unnamed protein product [Phytomonas sp. Hart1]|nr:unnamed protein product [Phytomonas sp. Hart1]|eukprot:CCW65990.1 unnamed protein product [Phytomonas sp. isolate Hart1]
MKVYRDIFTDAEVFCDNDLPLDVEDDVVYVIDGKYIDIGGEDYGISANVDEDAAEGATGETADGKQRVVDIMHNNRYVETFYDKASYLAHVREYMKKLLKNIEGDDAKKAFQTNAANFAKKVMKEINEYQFFIPDRNEEDPDSGIIVLCRWYGETPKFYYWKDGLKGERV